MGQVLPSTVWNASPSTCLRLVIYSHSPRLLFGDTGSDTFLLEEMVGCLVGHQCKMGNFLGSLYLRHPEYFIRFCWVYISWWFFLIDDLKIRATIFWSKSFLYLISLKSLNVCKMLTFWLSSEITSQKRGFLAIIWADSHSDSRMVNGVV